jgi:PAS domain S-box-containing protein
MRKAMEHAGAERGLLIIPRGDELQIEAESRISGNDVIVSLGDASVAAALPESILRYVMRTHDSVILDDASSANLFSADPYFLQNRVRSILCLPLINQVKLTGVLYLENNMAARVFTPDRITVLKVLVSQAAISLENTRLYRDLEDREARIRRLVDANVVGIVMWNLEGVMTGANEVFLRMVQYDREDLASGRVRWTDLTPPEWRERDERAIAELKAKGVFQPFEKEYFRKDGSRVPVLLGGTLFEGSRDEGVAFILDLSEQKRSEERYRIVVETASDAVITADESGLILFTNPATKRIFGYDSTELIGRPLTTLMPEFMRKLHEAGFKRYLATGQRHINWQGTELIGMRKNGEEFPLEISFGEQIRNGHRVFTGFVRDISEKKRAEEERERLRQAQADLAHINRISTMGELAASLAHEIKQPISAAMIDARTCSRWLTRDRPDLAEAQTAASRVVKDVARASEIIGRVRSLFKKDSLQHEEVDINELIQEMIALLRGEASRHSISIHSDLSPDLPPIMADRVQLQQVLMNLMLNSIEAMKDMNTPGKLTIKSQQDDSGQLLISVMDTGVGIPPEKIEQIFNAFFTSKPQGTGMGLPISRSIIESHGGRLWATPNAGTGTTFHFTLPTRRNAHQVA